MILNRISLRWSWCLRLSWRQLCGQLTAYAPEVTHQNGDGLRTNQSQWQSPHHWQQGGIRHRLWVFMGFPGVLPRHSRWDYQSESLSRGRQRSQRTTLIPDQDDVVSTECVGYVDIRVLSPRRRRAVGLLSGLRVLSCQLLFCLVTSALSAPCPLKDHVALASLSFINGMLVPSCVSELP